MVVLVPVFSSSPYTLEPAVCNSETSSICSVSIRSPFGDFWGSHFAALGGFVAVNHLTWNLFAGWSSFASSDTAVMHICLLPCSTSWPLAPQQLFQEIIPSGCSDCRNEAPGNAWVVFHQARLGTVFAVLWQDECPEETWFRTTRLWPPWVVIVSLNLGRIHWESWECHAPPAAPPDGE